MKRNLYLNLLMLFILSACQPGPAGQGQVAINNPTSTNEPSPTTEPTSTPEPQKTAENQSEVFKFNDTFPETWSDEYSEVTLEDLTSGRLLKQEREYVKNNKIFSNEVIPPLSLSTFEEKTTGPSGYSATIKSIVFMDKDSKSYSINQSTRPVKIISFFKLYDPILFDELGIDKVIEYKIKVQGKTAVTKEDYLKILKKYPAHTIIFWAYANPDGTTGIGNSLVSKMRIKSHLEIAREDSKELQFLPAFKQYKISASKDEQYNFESTYTFLENLYTKYPNLRPNESFINLWLETGQIPKELESSLFTYQASIDYW